MKMTMVTAIALLSSALLFAQNEYLKPKGLAPSPGYTHVVVTRPGKLIYLSGQVGNDSSGQIIGKGDLKVQTEQVFANLKAALASAGATFDDVVKINWYVKDFKPEQLATLREIRNKYVNKDNPPASTLVGVPSLFRDDCLIEVEAIAVIPEKKK
jgi:enamine deaminase RidA (YjgF/YER057c/UK114 family)